MKKGISRILCCQAFCLVCWAVLRYRVQILCYHNGKKTRNLFSTLKLNKIPLPSLAVCQVYWRYLKPDIKC